jgi:CPA2 family monovalent cation:H+ antiporter-2
MANPFKSGMPHHSPLLFTIVIGLVLAFILGALAQKLRISPIVGYLLAGVAVGPHTPGLVADQNMANQLAEIGVILLMFGVGLHFSIKDLLSVRAIALPGAITQMAVATVLGFGLSQFLGWTYAAGLVFGLALSVASTVVLLKALQDARLIDTEPGRIAVGWLIVEDLAMILVLVVLPAIAAVAVTNSQEGNAVGTLAISLLVTLAKVAAFVAIMLLVGKRIIPRLMHYIAHTGSRELFRLAVLAIALGVAYFAAVLFGVSFALGAFFAGMILSESELSQRAATESLPLRDAFAVLFFVSVGMLFNPQIVLEAPLALFATVLIIVLGKSLAAFAIVKLFGHPTSTALTISASLAQIGEFSFILAGLGVSLALLPEPGRDLILAGALISILLNPFFFRFLVSPGMLRVERHQPAPALPPSATVASPRLEHVQSVNLSDHIILVGHGRVGSFVSKALANGKLLVIELDHQRAREAVERGIDVIEGNAADPKVLSAAEPVTARCLIVAIPDGFEGGQVVQQARQANPNLLIISRAHSGEEVEHLKRHGASNVVLGEDEMAKAILALVPH